MSSYNDNFHSIVISSLQAQELELKNKEAQQNASMFTLYYAQGATLKASEELESIRVIVQQKMDVKLQAAANSNISSNLLDSATQANTYVKQSISNSAICAANVQLAANAILRLASDLGSICNVVNATDAKSDIYVLAEESRNLINQTAYEAELASQIAMDASMRTSEVTASTVLDKSKANNDLMNSVLKAVSDEFATVSQEAVAENATLAAASAIEKQVEGNYLDISVEYRSTKSAYEASNKGLNLNLSITNNTSTGFTANFDRIKMPFINKQVKVQTAANPFYPVKENGYYLIVVKDIKKSMFSISNAENLLISDKETAQTITASNAGDTSHSGNEKVLVKQKKIIIPLADSTASSLKSVTRKPEETDFDISMHINLQEMKINGKGSFYTILDSDGDEIKLGTRYVVFVLALYADDYKKKLNCFDDFLSAPSPSFTITNKLAEVNGKTIAIKEALAQTPALPYDYLLSFTVEENPAFAGIVEYRCIFLPLTNPLAGLLQNEESTIALNQEVELIESIAERYDPHIADEEAKVIGIENYINVLNDKLQVLQADSVQTSGIGNAQSSSNANEIQSQIIEVTAQITAQKYLLNKSNARLLKTQKDKQAEINSAKDASLLGKVGFLFNLKIAEQVLAGNYIVASNPVLVTNNAPSMASTTNTSKTKNNRSLTKLSSGYPTCQWDIYVSKDATDNFGSPLMSGQIYVPVILSYCTATEENWPMFDNSWSGYAQSPKFLYKRIISENNSN